MANSVIEQKPLYNQLPVGQEIIFVISNQEAVSQETKVKFCVEVFVSEDTPPVTDTATDRKGTFKTTPNGSGVGIFDLRNIVENYVEADSMAANGSAYKLAETTSSNQHPLHLIDKFTLSNNSVRYLALVFYVEYLDTDPTSITYNKVARAAGTDVSSELYSIFNGYLKYTDKLDLFNNDFGFDTGIFNPSSIDKRYLTNAPTTQYANSGDYGTVSFYAPSQSSADEVNKINVTYYNEAGVAISLVDTIVKEVDTGAYSTWNSSINKQILYFGCFPGNLQNWSTNYANAVTDGLSYYTIQADDNSGAIGSSSLEKITIYVNCPNGKDFESIRLCWLNQWGAWDYYTFTMKSIKSTSTSGSTYQQLGGTWNESTYKIDSYKGGKKTFRRNATEKITMNTDFVTESESVMFEELINSPEVYLLQGYQTDNATPSLNQYVTPVRLTTSTFTKKTVANDNIMQYTFEIEKSKTLRTQSI